MIANARSASSLIPKPRRWRWRQALAASFKPGDVIVLIRSTGSREDRLCEGLVRDGGCADRGQFPDRFRFVNEYRGEQPLYHFDLYRLNDSR